MDKKLIFSHGYAQELSMNKASVLETPSTMISVNVTVVTEQ